MFFILFGVFLVIIAKCYSADVFACNYTDENCLTDRININYRALFADDADFDYPLNPLQIEIVEATTRSLIYQLTNTTITGLQNCTFANTRSSEDLIYFDFDFYCPSLNFTGQYLLNGYILKIPVAGDGNYSIITGPYNVSISATHKKYVEGNATYFQIATFNIMSIDEEDPINYDFENLISFCRKYGQYGDPNTYLNKNSQEVAFLIPDPLWYSIIARIFADFNKGLAVAPIYTENS